MGIDDRETALAILDNFFAPNRYPKAIAMFDELVGGDDPANVWTQVSVETLRTSLLDILNIGEEDLSGIDSVAAWDFMRCVNVVKQSYNAGYITEEEAWDYLKRNAALAEETYDDWQHYFIAFMLARSIGYTTTGTDAYIEYAKQLFDDPQCEWSHPSTHLDR